MADNQKKKKQILGVESNVFFVGLTSFLTDTTTKMVYSILPLFLTTLGASKTEISLIEGIAESTASVLKSLSGWSSYPSGNWSSRQRKYCFRRRGSAFSFCDYPPSRKPSFRLFLHLHLISFSAKSLAERPRAYVRFGWVCQMDNQPDF